MTENGFRNATAAGIVVLVGSFVVDTAHQIWSRHKTYKALRDSIAAQEKREQERHQRLIDQQNDLDQQLIDMERDRRKTYEEARKNNDAATEAFKDHLNELFKSLNDNEEEDDGLE